jgi:broad specificity phosphatase PhoE
LADIWLMRHAAYEGHRPGHHAPPDAPLSAEGRAQILRVLPLPTEITAIVTSPLLRAHQTADLLSYLTGLPLIGTSALLSEWRAPSVVSGRTAEEYPTAYLAWREQRKANPSLACMDGESLADLHHRAGRCADYLSTATRDQGGGIIVISHKLLLGVLTRLTAGPQAFEAAAQAEWPFADRRPFDPTG